ncbi:unnamed protein product [Staurois parvus]|uniref:Uncharacterized protein n=1 Tax=Staurois parvus TaxID=386267 RepID=A0ABN9BRZ3_9NEOB|nr:unnamed protein product [Staurois parvus]
MGVWTLGVVSTSYHSHVSGTAYISYKALVIDRGGLTIRALGHCPRVQGR